MWQAVKRAVRRGNNRFGTKWGGELVAMERPQGSKTVALRYRWAWKCWWTDYGCRTNVRRLHERYFVGRYLGQPQPGWLHLLTGLPLTRCTKCMPLLWEHLQGCLARLQVIAGFYHALRRVWRVSAAL